MKAVLLGALLLLTAACGAYQFPGSPAPQTGTVSGTVLFSNIGCPGSATAGGLCAAGGPADSAPLSPCPQYGFASGQCPVRPAPGLEIDFVRGDATSKAVTDSSGKYTVQLASGTWQVQLKTPMRRIKGPSEVSVTAGSTVTADFVIDSGIRYAVPQG